MKSFDEKKVLLGISFHAEGGKAFGLLGRNGAGKTTAIRILMNVFPADSGEIRIDGQPVDYRKISLGFFIYAVMFGAVGSTVSKLEDINTAVMPVTMLFVIAFLVVIFSMTSANVDNPAMIVCSFIPFTSPMSMFTRIAMSTVPWYQIILSILILIGSAIGIGFFSAKIYRAGVLMYGTRPRIRSILGSIRKG